MEMVIEVELPLSVGDSGMAHDGWKYRTFSDPFAA
jgi:hypothetical protein